jgi:ribosomal protein S18 acetylase RimI-like enzyme
MSNWRDYPDAADATVISLTEEQLADRLVCEGVKVVRAHGRYWQRTGPGLYQSIHWLARHAASESKRPLPVCIGYRAALRDDDAASANGTLPIHVISDVENYDIEQLSARVRRELRQFERNDVRIVWVNHPEVLCEQGYDVMLSWIGRTRHRAPHSTERYLRDARKHVDDQTWLVLAGLRGDRLLGYTTSWMVDGAAYIWDAHVSTEALSLHLGTALWFETAQVYRRSGLAREICAGLAMPERPGLTSYKNRLGFELVRIPTRVWLLPVLSGLTRSRYPAQYYRFTGEGPCADAGHPTDRSQGG